MPEEPMQAAGTVKPGGGSPERRRAGDAGNLEDFRRELLREMNKRDERVARELKEQMDASAKLHRTQMDANHGEVMDAIHAVQATQLEHKRWMADADAVASEEARVARDLAQKVLWEKELTDKALALVAAKRAKRAQAKPYIYTGMGAIASGSVLYVLENLASLHWDVQTQAITALFALMGLLTLLLVLR